nr:hypothetical protein Cry52Nrm1_p161 [Cryptomonas curvata]
MSCKKISILLSKFETLVLVLKNSIKYLDLYLYTEFRYQKNYFYVWKNNFIISKNLLFFIRFIITKLTRNFCLGFQILINNIFKLSGNYNTANIIIIFSKIIASVNRILLFYSFRYYLNSIYKKLNGRLIYSVIVDLQKLHHEYISLIGNRYITRLTNNKFINLYLKNYVNNIFTLKIFTVLIEKETFKINLMYENSRLHCFLFFGNISTFYYTLLFDEKRCSCNYSKKVIKFFFTKNDILHLFLLTHKLNLWYTKITKINRIYIHSKNSLYLIRFFFLLFISNLIISINLIKILLKKILFYIGDLNISTILKIIEHITLITNVKSVKKFCFIKYKLTDRCQKILNFSNYLKNQHKVKNTFILEKKFKIHQHLNQISYFHSLHKSCKDNLFLKIIKRSFLPKNSLFILMISSFKFSNYSLHNFYINNMNYNFSKTRILSSNFLCLFSSGFRQPRKNILLYLMNYYKTKPIYLWFLQECFLLETNKLKDKEFFYILFSNKIIKKIAYCKVYSKYTQKNWLKALSFLCIGLFRIRFLKIIEQTKEIVRVINLTNLKHKEMPFLHFYLSSWNILNLNKIFFCEKKKCINLQVGFNLNREWNLPKKICLYIKNLKRKYLYKTTLFLYKKNIEYNYLVKRQKNLSKIIQDSADLDYIINAIQNNLHEIIKKNKSNIKFLFANNNKKLIVCTKKISFICNLNFFLKNITRFGDLYKIGQLKFPFFGCCFFCFLATVIKKKSQSVILVRKKFFCNTNFLEKEIFFFSSEFFTIYKSSIDLLKKRNFYFSGCSKFFQYVKKNMRLKNINFYKFIKIHQIYILFSGFISFFSFLVLLCYNSGKCYFSKVPNINRNFNFLFFLYLIIDHLKDPLIEFVFHLEKKKTFKRKLNVLTIKRNGFFTYKCLFFFNATQLLSHLNFNICRIFYEKITIFNKFKELNPIIHYERTYLKMKILNISYFFFLLFFIKTKTKQLNPIERRLFFSFKSYIYKFGKIKNEMLFYYSDVDSNSLLLLDIHDVLIKNKKVENFLIKNHKFFYRKLVRSNNIYSIKSWLFIKNKNIFKKYYKYQSKNKRKEKFLCSSFWFFFTLVYKKNENLTFNSLSFFIGQLLKNNKTGDFIIVFYINFFFLLPRSNIEYHVNTFKKNLRVMKKLYNKIIKNIRLNFYGYSFLNRFITFERTKKLYIKKINNYISNKSFMYFFRKKTIFFSNTINFIAYLLGKYKKFIDSGNVSKSKNLIILSYLVIHIFKQRMKDICIENNKVFELFYFLIPILPLNLYLDLVYSLINLFYKSFHLKKKILLILHVLITLYPYIRQLFLLSNIKKFPSSLFTTKKKIKSYIKNKNLLTLFYQFHKEINYNSHINSLLLFCVVSLAQFLLIEKCKVFLTLVIDFLSRNVVNIILRSSLKKIIFILSLKLKNRLAIWFINKITKILKNDQYFLLKIFNTDLVISGFILSKNIILFQKISFFKKLAIFYYYSKNKILRLQNILEKIGYYILRVYGYILFDYSSPNFLLEILELIYGNTKENPTIIYKILSDLVVSAFKWNRSRLNLYQFSYKLLSQLLSKIKNVKKLKSNFLEKIRLQFFFIYSAIRLFLKKKKK